MTANFILPPDDGNFWDRDAAYFRNRTLTVPLRRAEAQRRKTLWEQQQREQRIASAVQELCDGFYANADAAADQEQFCAIVAATRNDAEPDYAEALHMACSHLRQKGFAVEWPAEDDGSGFVIARWNELVITR